MSAIEGSGAYIRVTDWYRKCHLYENVHLRRLHVCSSRTRLIVVKGQHICICACKRLKKRIDTDETFSIY